MNLFAYGTLMWPEVLETVIGRRVGGMPATLHGFRRLRVKEKLYPALVDAHSHNVVEGIFYRDLTEEEFRRLDRFEGEEYDRKEVCIGTQRAHVYVLNGGWRHIADSRPWRPEDLQKKKLQAFCAECRGENA